MNKPKTRPNLLVTRLLKTLAYVADQTKTKKFPTNHHPLPWIRLLLTKQWRRPKTQLLS